MVKAKVWRDRKFRRWDVPTKLIAFYFLTNPDVPPAGIYEVNLDAVRISVGLNGETFDNSFRKLQEDQWLMYDPHHEFVWIINALRHMPSINASVMVNVYASLREAPRCEIVDKFKEKYANLLAKYDTLATGWEQGGYTSRILNNIKSNKIISDVKTQQQHPVKDLFDHWEKCFKDATGERYSFFGDRDGKLFKTILKNYGKEKSTALISEFFKQADEDPKCWWSDKLDVSVWFKQIPKLVSQLTRG